MCIEGIRCRLWQWRCYDMLWQWRCYDIYTHDVFGIEVQVMAMEVL